MRRITIATAVLGVVTTMLTTTGPPAAAARYDARAGLSGERTCSMGPKAGVTRRTLVLDNRRSAERVQYRVVRRGDRFAEPAVYVWVPAHRRKTLTVSVPQRTTVSVRVRVPEMGFRDLRLSATVAALASCYRERVDPRASLGGVSCHDGDSVAQIVLDNRATTDDEVEYAVASSYGDASAVLTVEPATSTRYYLTVPAGRSTQVDVTASGRRVLSTEIAAVACP